MRVVVDATGFLHDKLTVRKKAGLSSGAGSRKRFAWHSIPGTVDTPLSSPFGKTSLNVQSPDVAAKHLLAVIAGLGPNDSGGFSTIAGSVCLMSCALVLQRLNPSFLQSLDKNISAQRPGPGDPSASNWRYPNCVELNNGLARSANVPACGVLV